jgi:hypothetical protein
MTVEDRRMQKIFRRHEVPIADENSRREPPGRKTGWLWSRRRGSGSRANVLVRYNQSPLAEIPIEQRRLLVARLVGIFRTSVMTGEHYSQVQCVECVDKILCFRYLFAIITLPAVPSSSVGAECKAWAIG